MRGIFLFVALLSLVSLAQTNKKEWYYYTLKYNGKTKECTFLENGRIVEFFDKRFDRNIEAPKNSYRCFAIRKEQFNFCTIVKNDDTTALLFSYGAYPYTNLVLALMTPTPSLSATLLVKCTKKLPKK